MTADTCTACGRDLPEGPSEMHLDALDPEGPLVLLCAECGAYLEGTHLTEDLDDTAGETLPDPLPEGPTVGLSADAPPGDTYGREQAARLLGVSPRRVSQLADDGRLTVVQEKPLRLSAESVHSLRESRRSPGRDQRATVPPDPAGDVAAQIERVVALVVAENRKAIEAGEHLLSEVSAQRDRAEAEAERQRAEVDRLRADLDAERVARLEAEARANKRWWSRKK